MLDSEGRGSMAGGQAEGGQAEGSQAEDRQGRGGGHPPEAGRRVRPLSTAAIKHSSASASDLSLDMQDIHRDLDKPLQEACIAAKASVIVRVGMLDLGSGTGSFRVREMMHRIARSMGVHVRAEVNLTDIEATCTDGAGRITEVVDLPTTGVNTERIWFLEHFADWLSVNCGLASSYHKSPEVSQELVDHLDELQAHWAVRKAQEAEAQAAARAVKARSKLEPEGVTVRQAHERLDRIENRQPLYSPLFSAFGAAVACAAFVFLLGGGLYDMAGAFVGAGIGQFIRRLLLGNKINQFFVTALAVIVAALACIGTLRLVGLFDPIALRHDTAYIGSILFVIPGFPLVTGGLDIAKMDLPSGVQRLTYAFSLILVATFGGWAVARMVQLNPQGFEALNLDPWVNAGLRALAAFCGVWGFSVLFNSPQRMALVAALIGAITDTLRLEMQDVMGMPPEMAAFVGAFLAGLLATAWRSSVRHGWLPPGVGFPRICLTVPAIVIMVPGLYMYRAMFYLGQFNTLSALDWAFRAFMVIICLPIGLATARVFTDRSWRYDV